MNFVLGHPRSGTAFCAHLLNCAGTFNQRIAEHEFLCSSFNAVIIAKATQYYHGECSKSEILPILEAYETDSSLLIDANWKLTWIIEPLLEKFPDAKFLHIVRDPRENVRACYNLDYYGDSIEKVCSDEGLDFVARQHFSDEKNPLFEASCAVRGFKYWYDNLPAIRTPDWKEMDTFERNCMFWFETHDQIIRRLGGSNNYLSVRLDQLVDTDYVKKVFSFFELPVPDEDTITAAINADINPQSREKHVMGRLHDHELPPYPQWPQKNISTLNRICSDIAHRFGWDLL